MGLMRIAKQGKSARKEVIEEEKTDKKKNRGLRNVIK